MRSSFGATVDTQQSCSLLGTLQISGTFFFSGNFMISTGAGVVWSTGMKTGEAETTRKHLQPLKFDIRYIVTYCI